MDWQGLHRPTFRFEAVGEHLPDYGWDIKFFEYSPPQQKLILSDGWRVVSIEPRDGSHRVVHQTGRMHRISCLHPRTGDVIFSLLQDDLDGGWDFFSLEVGTGRVSGVALPPLDGDPFWGVTPCRIIDLAGGDRVFISDDDGCIGFRHLDSSGACIAYDESSDFDRPLIDPWNPCNNDAIFETDGYGLYAWFFETHESVLISGSDKAWGCRDGIGWRARFWRLQRPAMNRRYLFVVTEGPQRWQWRDVRLDLQTMHAQTVRFVGVDHDECRGYCVSDKEVFFLQASRSAEPSALELFRAPLESGEQPAELSQTLAAVDLAEPVRPVVFRLAGGVTLQVDRRLLMARSAYFRDMLTSGLREDTSSEVDLTNDSDADMASLSVLLRYVLGDTWDGSQNDAELAFRVRALADRYRLPWLVDLAEAHLHRMLTPGTALAFLGRIVGSGGALEEACWALMDSDRNAILKAGEADVSEIIAQNPELAKKLILWQTGAEADPAARLNKRHRTA